MYLYVANCTIQTKRVFFRLDFDTSGERDPRSTFMQPKHVDIGSGRQYPVGGDLHEVQVREIEEQLRLYGAIDVSEAQKLPRRADFVLSRNKPVPAQVIERVYGLNNAILVREGVTRRQQAAIAANDALQHHVEDQVPKFEVEVQQLDESGVEGEKMLEEGVRVVRNPTAAPPAAPRRASGRRAA